MKTIYCILVVAMVCGTIDSSWGYAPVFRVGVNLIDEAVKCAAKVSGRSLNAGVRRAAVRQINRAVQKHGDDVFRAARYGGLEFIEAAARYGDDVWSFAKQVPEANRLLALSADELVPLVRRLGVDVLRVEVVHPGMSSQVVKAFGDDAIRFFARKVPAKDATRLIGYARKADSASTRKALLRAYRKKGPVFLERLSWNQIMAYGLSASMITAAYQVSDGFQEGLKILPEKSPEVFHAIGKDIIRPFTLPVLIFGAGVAVILLWRFHRNNRWLKGSEPRKKFNPTDCPPLAEK